VKALRWSLIFLFIFTQTSWLSAQLLSTNPAIEQRIETLLQQMTLAEKIGQLHQVSGVSDETKILVQQGKIGSLLNIPGAKMTNELQRIAVEESRLKIPLIFGLDVIHGYRTVFPIPLGEAATWDPSLVEKTAAMAAKEARASGVHWNFAPMVDIARDPRWGRIAEGSGEDPYLGSVLARARVKGFQGNNLSDPTSVVACPKHYVAYGAAEGGRDYNMVDISLKTLREVYLPPFKAAIDAGAGTIMSAFNDLNGMPASANSFTLNQILRNEWRFQGFVVSDWNSIGELLNHGIGASLAEVGKKALLAGVDMDMMGFAYTNNLANLVQQGQIEEKSIDEAVRRVLRIKFLLGLFDRPYVDPQLEESTLMSPENLALALESSRKSIVLLKNEGQLLPLKKNIKLVAVIGPLADNDFDPLGCWHCEGKAKDVVTVLEGIKNKISPEKVQYAEGCKIQGNLSSKIDKAVDAAKKADVAIVVVGESAGMSGEASSRSSLDLPGRQNDLVKGVYEAGVPTVVVLMSGRPLSIPWIAENIPAILETWQLGVQCGNAIADVIFGDYNPGGKLPVTFPRTVGQVPIYYNHKNTGRPPTAEKFTSKYMDIPITPQFPFGFGLSYTKFAFSDLRVSTEKVSNATKISASVAVQNIGDQTGDEVVQLYVQDVVASMTRPVKELKRFQRITLQPNEKKLVDFQLDANELGFYNQNLQYVVEPGQFKIWIGPSSVEGLEGSFEIR
jgi:beta-glucosidase